MSKGKRKSSMSHDDMTGPPAARRQVSYQDIETEPTPPVPRQQVLYTSDDEDARSDASSPAAGRRHEIMSCKSNAKGASAQARPKTDLTYGQTSAFPGLDSYADEPFYGPANDGLDYLRMVRSEARGIPHVVTVAQEAALNEYGDGEGHDTNHTKTSHAEGYYENGAYVARPSPTRADDAMVGGKISDAQEQYYAALRRRFLRHRVRLHQTPSAAAVAALDHDHPISLPSHNEYAIREWRTLVVSTTPHSAQLASMDSNTVLRILHLTEGQLESCIKQSQNLPANLTLWFWALLGRLDEEWTLQTTDIGIVRHLAKMSITLALSLTGDKAYSDDPHAQPIKCGQIESLNCQDHTDSDVMEHAGALDGDISRALIEQGQDEVNEGAATPLYVDASDTLSDLLAAKKQQLLADSLAADTVPNMSTLATLDMIVTIAGHFYGQRDLLDLRQKWEHAGD